MEEEKEWEEASMHGEEKATPENGALEDDSEEAMDNWWKDLWKDDAGASSVPCPEESPKKVASPKAFFKKAAASPKP